MPKFSSPDFAPLPDRPHLKPKEIAAFLSLSVQSVYNLIAEKEFLAAEIGGLYVVKRRDFDKWYHSKFGILPNE